MEKEYIICAAIHVKDGNKHQGQPKNIDSGFVVAGRRHNNCYATIQAIAGLDEAIKKKILSAELNTTLEEQRKCQGFLTSTDRYVDRKEGWKIALANNQIVYGLKASSKDDDEEEILISENLY